jgi:hypothetical protein
MTLTLIAKNLVPLQSIYSLLVVGTKFKYYCFLCIHPTVGKVVR